MVRHANAARLKETDFAYCTEGAFGLIFVNAKSGRALKVFRRKHEASEDHCRSVFNSEIEAYGLASSSPEVRALVPGFYGVRSGLIVLDQDGNDVSAEFIPDLAYEMEFVAGYFQKMGTVANPEADRVRQLFRNAGICYLTDASVMLTNGKITKVIDFAVREFEI